MSWPRTMPDLLHLALAAVSVAQGLVFIGLALLLIAFIWWVFRVRRDPELSIFAATRFVLILALLAVLILAFVPFVRWIRQLTS
jgi:hypothetical protein